MDGQEQLPSYTGPEAGQNEALKSQWLGQQTVPGEVQQGHFNEHVEVDATPGVHELAAAAQEPQEMSADRTTPR